MAVGAARAWFQATELARSIPDALAYASLSQPSLRDHSSPHPRMSSRLHPLSFDRPCFAIVAALALAWSSACTTTSPAPIAAVSPAVASSNDLARDTARTPETAKDRVGHSPIGTLASRPGVWAGRAFSEGLVSASHPLAAEAGALVLARGGNAVDAAATVQFVLNVVEPQYSGIGGGFFMLAYFARSGESIALDARERAPAAASPAMFRFSNVGPDDRFAVASTSGISVGVPGTLLGIATALQRWGTITLAEALAPAIELAESGFPINSHLAANIASSDSRTSLQAETAAIFRPNGSPLKAGETLRQPDLAATFRLIAQQGTDVFYRGEIASAIVRAQQRSRTPIASEGVGRIVLDDLTRYQVAIRRPLRGSYRGLEVITMPPPSSGGVALLQALGMLERFPLGEPDKGFGLGSVATMHVTIESLRIAFADRAFWLGDPDLFDIPVGALLDPAYVRSRGAPIDRDRRLPTPSPGGPKSYPHARSNTPLPFAQSESVERGGHTTHFTIVDRLGNVVAVTSTIEETWGSGITVPGYGFLLNNELTDFNLEPVADDHPERANPGANDAAGNKRPRSSMTPTLLLRNGKPLAAYGSPGGATIIGTILQTTLNLVDHRLLMQPAIDAPRIAVTSAGGGVRCEGPAAFLKPKITIVAQDGLRRLGHPGLGADGTDACNATIGSVQGALLDPASGRQYGGADLRREGTVAGLPRSP